MKLVMRRTFAAIAAGAALAASVTLEAGPVWAQGKVLKFVQNGNLTILDPIWTTAYVTRNHGYFIYDTLFASDENNAVKPQMVDKYEVSPDKTVWTFTLRDGLEWHDGKPVTSEDCIASIQRWGKRDAMGLKLMDFVKEFKAVDAKTFQMVLKEPYGLVLDSLGKPSSNVPFMMPKAVAETDAFKQIDSQIGSGPFIYVNAESKPGEKHVYIKNPKYKPRSEPASGLAGGKVVKVDRVEIVEMPDPQQQVNALIERRDRPDRAAAARPDPGAEEGQERAARRLEPAGSPVHHPLQPPGEAVRQSQDPPGARSTRCARRTISRRPSASPNTTRSARPPSSAARPTPSTRPTACWSSRTSRNPRRSSRKRATTARRSC